MVDEKNDEVIECEQFIYGNYKGYKMKAYSKNGIAEGYVRPYQGFFLPISQSDLKYMHIPHLILSNSNAILFSRIVKGLDEYKRGAVENHTVIVPKQFLLEGAITYEELDRDMEKFEAEHKEAVGNLPLFSIHREKNNIDEYIKELQKYLNRGVVEKLIAYYRENSAVKIFLHVPNSSEDERLKMAYLLSMLLDIKLRLTSISVFSDVPYTDATRIFNLIISRIKPDIKPGEWVMVPVKKEDTPTSSKETIDKTIDDIFGSK
ncbi:MAG: hypothetical protein M1481_06440 [Candidatus Thermoplasmatota archaeon]|jgi:hypothetical protein|nr:hypothetical protein [Candidatus Thermoplasmatota archaeon]MCL5963728.1 hypothetical protein [Candidatus Thermoplasmatota archaeon]